MLSRDLQYKVHNCDDNVDTSTSIRIQSSVTVRMYSPSIPNELKM